MSVLVAVAGGLLLTYALLVGALLAARPADAMLRDALRTLPDVLRLVRRLAADRGIPRGVRIRLWLLLGYLAMPFDIVPDFIPVIGYADDAVLIAIVLRSVVRHAGSAKVAEHWPGSAAGLRAVEALAGRIS